MFGYGGIITAPASSSVTVNGRPVALFGAIYTPHWGCTPKKLQHCFGFVFDLPAGVSIEGQTPITKGGLGICGHKPTTASSDVFIVGGGLGIVGSILGAVLQGSFSPADGGADAVGGGLASTAEQAAINDALTDAAAGGFASVAEQTAISGFTDSFSQIADSFSVFTEPLTSIADSVGTVTDTLKTALGGGVIGDIAVGAAKSAVTSVATSAWSSIVVDNSVRTSAPPPNSGRTQIDATATAPSQLGADALAVRTESPTTTA
jgi:hypothetical protein